MKLFCESAGKQAEFDRTCTCLGLENDDDSPLALVQTAEHIELRKLDEPKLGAVWVNFTQGTLAHRRQFGGGRGEAVAKAVGVKQAYLPSVLDATAGLGRDAFVLASIGCKVRLVERNPVVYALLQDGLARAYRDDTIGMWMRERMQLLPLGSIFEQSPECADVVYLDPMFPHRQKSALVKKEMRVFQSLVGEDVDADVLLKQSAVFARKRVVVKRPSSAPYLANIMPQGEVKTKNHRFDLYYPQTLLQTK
nr:class I SAM-dependent methyltransferase [Spirabiliibacterium falconis]